MSEAAALQTQTTKASASTSSSLLVQRKCACGGSSGLSGSCSDCEKKKLLGHPLQTKLRISEPGDEYEQEADRVAEQVMRMADPMFEQDSGNTRARLVQRKVSGSSPAIGSAPPIVHEVLASPGQPLDAATRAFFEPRFGHDFTRVRIHSDAKAAESARSINARAYTVGDHVVVAAQETRATTSPRDGLLAHELAHVIQQARRDELPLPAEMNGRQSSPARAKMLHETEWISVRAFPSSARVQRATKEKQPLDVPVFDRLRQSRNKSYQCSEHEKRYVEEAYSEARQWLDRSITWIRALTSPIFFLSKVQEPAKNALETHFKSSNTDTARVVLLNLEQIRGNIPTRREYQLAGSPGYQQEIAIGMGPRVPMTINAILCNGSECKPSTGAYYRSAISSITFCPHFFRRKAQAPGFLIHELAHSLGFGGSVLDYAYGQDRLYAGLTTAEAVLNADSYANFVEELATGKAKRMVAPQDRLAKCPDDWVPLVTAAIARAHQWARVAEKMYSGATTDPQAVAYQKVKDALVKSTTVSCRPAGAPQCQPGNSWFKDIGVSAIFLCPDWKGMSEDDRTIAVMAGLIGYFGGPGEKPDWEKYAAEAGALTRSKLNVAPITPPPAASTP